MVQQLGLEKSSPVSFPGAKDDPQRDRLEQRSGEQKDQVDSDERDDNTSLRLE